MVHCAGQIGIRKSYSAKRRSSQNFARRRFVVSTKEESGLRAQVGVAPTIQDNASDITPRVKTRTAKHVRELLPNLLFIVRERSPNHLSAAAISLLFSGVSGIGIQNFQAEDNGRVWTDCGIVHTGHGQLANIHVVAKAFEPAATTHSHLVKKPPIPERNIGHHAWRRSEERRVGKELRA